MKVCVQWASSGSPEIAAARIAAAGATSSTLHPRKASHIEQGEREQYPEESHGSRPP